jgi:hypothetical protein
MSTRPPEIRRKFSHPWDEIQYLYHQMLYWLFERNDRARAARWSPRLSALLAQHDPLCEAILGAAARALVAEAAGDLWSAIRARQRELELIEQLNAADAPAEAQWSASDIADRLDLLAGLYWDAEDLDRAEEILLQSQRWCAEHKIKFDGREMLHELRQEKRSRSKSKRVAARQAS